MVYIWLAIACGTLIFELGHPGLFYFLSFSCGAIAAAVAACFAYDLFAQVTVCAGATALSIVALRRWADHLHHKEVPTNVHALQGKIGTVIKAITPSSPGQVKVNGEIWTARCQENRSHEPHTTVTVIRVSGSHIIVSETQHPRKDS